MKRVLFVDDEPRILEGLRRMLRSKRDEWWTQFESSGQAALDAIKGEPFDIVVSDMKMPGMNGAQLLSEVKRICPESIRIILSGHASNELILQAVGPTHQYLTKPCKPETLKATIERICTLQDLVGNPSVRARVSEMNTLPSLPMLYEQVTAELQAQASLKRICEIIGQDIAMTAKMLQLVNSDYFGVTNPISGVKQALALIDPEMINSLMLTAKIFSPYEGGSVPGFSIESLWRHSLRTAAFARTVGKLEGLDDEVVEEAFIAGMLHDAGKLILAAKIPERYGQALERVRDEGISVSEAETRVLGATHAQVGAYLLGLWGLPDPIVEATLYHTSPRESPRTELGTLTFVHVASGLARELEQTDTPAPSDLVDVKYLETLGLEARLPWWREACRDVVDGAAIEKVLSVNPTCAGPNLAVE